MNPFNPNEVYPCNANKYCVVFNEDLYNDSTQRKGTEVDAKRLEILFKQKLLFKFDYFPNFTERMLLDEYVVEIKQNCENMTCLFVIILSHGNRKNIIDIDGKQINIYEKIVKSFTANKFMEGIAKVFVLQSCRGDNYLTCHDGQCESNTDEAIPYISDVDTLMVFSAVSGSRAVRHENKGSLFIFYLCQVLEHFNATYDIVTMLTMLNQIMASKFLLFGKHKSATKKYKLQLLSSFKSQLTRKLFLSTLPPNPPASLTPTTIPDDFDPQHSTTIDHPQLYIQSNNQKEKLCILLSHTSFPKSQWKTGWRGFADEDQNKSLPYVDADLQRLNKLFSELNFTIIIQTNLDSRAYDNFMKCLENSLREKGIDLVNVTCVVVILLTNGDGDQMRTNGGTIDIRGLKKPYIDCKTLAAVPKIFIIQSCNGKKLGDDADEDECGELVGELHHFYYIPTPKDCPPPKEANVLISYSSCLDRENGQGSEFVEKLCNIFRENHANHDIVSMLTVLNRNICEQPMNPSQNVGKEKINEICMPVWFISRLTRKFYLCDNHLIG